MTTNEPNDEGFIEIKLSNDTNPTTWAMKEIDFNISPLLATIYTGEVNSPYNANQFFTAYRDGTANRDQRSTLELDLQIKANLSLYHNNLTYLEGVQLLYATMNLASDPFLDLVNYTKDVDIINQDYGITIAPNGTIFFKPLIENQINIPDIGTIQTIFPKNKYIASFFGIGGEPTAVEFKIFLRAHPSIAGVNRYLINLFKRLDIPREKIPEGLVPKLTAAPFYFCIDPLAKLTNGGTPVNDD